MSKSEAHFPGAEGIESHFPAMLSGEEWTENFDRLAANTPRFAALVVSIDDFEKKLNDLGETLFFPRLVRLGELLADMGPTRGLTWGRLDSRLFAAFCPDIDEREAVALAKELQDRYRNLVHETLSVGLAVYPFEPFAPKAILENARKALVHASFFGADTVTPFDAVSLNISGDDLYQKGDVEGAVAEFEMALRIDPQNLNVYNSLGVCYGVQGDLEKAVGAFQAAVEISPEDVMATYNLGLT
jgi:tetratricopeptide (TPR) repeat protein